jgi:hypothetical protein
MNYVPPKLTVIGSVAELTQVVKVLAPTSDGTYLHPHHRALNNYTSA